MTRVWWELNLVFWRKENLWHARGKAVSPGIESLLQGRGRPLPSCPFTSTCCSCWGRWGDTMSRLHFLFHHKPPSPTSVNEKCPPSGVAKLPVGQIWCGSDTDRKGLGWGLKGSEDREQWRTQEFGAGITAGRGESRRGIWSSLSCDKIGHLEGLIPFYYYSSLTCIAEVKINHS